VEIFKCDWCNKELTEYELKMQFGDEDTFLCEDCQLKYEANASLLKD